MRKDQGRGGTRDKGQGTRAKRVEKEMDAAAGGCGPRAAAFWEQSRTSMGSTCFILFSCEGKNLEFITGKGNKGKDKERKRRAGVDWNRGRKEIAPV